MSVAAPYLLAIGSIAVLLVAIAAIRVVGQHFGWTAEVQRKSVHVLVGLFAMAAPTILPGRWPFVSLVLLALAVMLLLRIPHFLGGAGAAIHSVQRRSFGDIWLAVAIGFLFLRSEGTYILYGLPLAIITLADAAAALTGSSYGRRRFATEDGVKSWEGVVAFTMVGWVTAMSMLLLFSDAPRPNVIVLGLVIAAFGAMVEAVSWRGLDNLFVPLAIHFFLQGFLEADPLTLGLVAAAFLAGAGAARAAAGRLHLSPITARAFAVALFIFIGVGEIYGTVFPALAMAAYLLTRPVLPGRGRHPALDFLGTLCSTAAIWFFIGETIGPTAIHFYSLAMAGIALAYLLLALAALERRWLALLPLVAIWAADVALAGCGLVRPKPGPHLPAVAALSLVLVAAAMLFAPGLFARWRAPRVALLASAVPLAAYLHQAGLP